MTASDTRRNWFRVLDEVLAGETVVVERNGRRVVLRAEDGDQASAASLTPDYSKLLRGDLDDAERWSCEWPGPEGDLVPIDDRLAPP